MKTKYNITVKQYMTQPTKEGSDFDFMAKFNDNKPMPSYTMDGEILKESKSGKMQFWSLVSGNDKWTGWIPKSAILSQTELIPEDSKAVAEKLKELPPVPEREIQLSIDEKKNKTVLRYGISVSPASQRLIGSSIQEFNGTVRDELIYYPVYVIGALKEYLAPCTENGDALTSTGRNPLAHYYIEDKTIQVDFPDISEVISAKPYNHQIEAYKYGMVRSKFLLGDVMGLGKTFEAITIALGKKRLYNFKHCLVICGVNSVKFNWASEIANYSNESAVVIDGTAEKKIEQLSYLTMNIPQDLSGFSKRERNTYEKARTVKDAFFLIVNVESFRNEGFANTVRNLCRQGYINECLFDEIHKCVNASSKQSLGVMQVCTDVKIALTGTPVVNKPEDAFFLFSWLDKTHAQYYQWLGVYTRKVGEHERIPINQDLLAENFRHIMLRRKKEDVLDLPDKVYTDELLPMYPEQSRAYANIELTDTPLVNLLRYRQCTSGFLVNDDTLTELPSIKLDRLQELLEEIITNNQKVVIFSNWTSTLDIIERVCAPYGLYRIDGNTPTETRQNIQEAWQREEEGFEITHHVLIGTIKAAGTGLNLNSATNVIFFEEPWTDVDKSQAVDRCHRIGTKSTVNVITLMCKDTVDEEVHNVVLNKKQMSELLVEYTPNRTISK